MTIAAIEKPRVINPEEDGLKHINIWYYGRSQLGRELAHFAKKPFIHPFFGPFNTMEGFWHYIKTGACDDRLRTLDGPGARKLGKELKWTYVENFQDIIMRANYEKINQHPALKKLLIDSTLPFMHYYIFKSEENTNGVVIDIVANAWMIKMFDDLREMFRYDLQPKEVDYSQFKKD